MLCFINDDVPNNSSKHNSADELSPDIFSLDNVVKKSETLACSRSHIRAINLHSRSLLLAVLSLNATTIKACLLCQEQGKKKMSPSNHRFVPQRGGFVQHSEPDKLLEYFFFLFFTAVLSAASRRNDTVGLSRRAATNIRSLTLNYA